MMMTIKGGGVGGEGEVNTYVDVGATDDKNECDDGADLSCSAVKTLLWMPW